MALTKDFQETVATRAKKDPEFRLGLLQEAISALQDNELDVAKRLLADYVNATAGYKKLSQLTKTPEKSLMRMLGPKGNPTIENFFGLLSPLLSNENARLIVRSQSSRNRSKQTGK